MIEAGQIGDVREVKEVLVRSTEGDGTLWLLTGDDNVRIHPALNARDL